MILSVVAFAQLAAQCGPSVHVDTLTAVARAESRLNPLAIHDNTTGKTFLPASPAEAVKIASDLVAQGHSADLGVMQVNSRNLAALGMNVADAFDACKNIAGGARVLTTAYKAPAIGADAQPALLRAISRYNTGDPRRGFDNGYVARVQLAAGQVVPAIRLAGSAPAGQEAEEESAAMPPPPPPSWDVFGQAKYRQQNGGAVFGGSTQAKPQTRPPGGGPEAGQSRPVQLQATIAPTGG